MLADVWLVKNTFFIGIAAILDHKKTAPKFRAVIL
jgi:hypothetical protein